MPIFFDEAIWIYWSKIIATTNHQWFYALTNGKMPLLTWLMVIGHKLMPTNQYMLAGRLPSVFLGFIGLIAVYKLAHLLFGKKTALICLLLFIFNPFELFYDRMALYDTGLSTMLIWSVYFTFKAAKKHYVKYFILWGVFLGLAFWFKATAFIFLAVTPILYLLSSRNKSLALNLKLTIIPIILSIIMANLIIFSHGFKNYWTVVLGFASGNGSTIDIRQKHFISTFITSIGWLLDYHGFAIIATSLISLVYIRTKYTAYSFSLLILTPLFFFPLVSGIYFTRYILFVSPYILMLSGYYISRQRKFLTLVLFITIIAYPLFSSFKIITDPPSAPLPENEKFDYITYFSSGYGLSTIYNAIRTESNRSPLPITLVVQGSFSHYPWAFNLEFWDDPKITIIERWPFTSFDQEIENDMTSRNVLFVIPQNRLANGEYLIDKLHLSVIAVGNKPGNNYPIYLAKFVRQ